MFTKDVLDGLVSRLAHGEVEERRRAAEELFDLGAEAWAAVPALIRAIERDDDHETRYEATVEGDIPYSPRLMGKLGNSISSGKGESSYSRWLTGSLSNSLAWSVPSTPVGVARSSQQSER
jgi:hypothetical protein